MGNVSFHCKDSIEAVEDNEKKIWLITYVTIL